MKSLKLLTIPILTIIITALCLTLINTDQARAQHAGTVDWSRVKSKTVTLFYPGFASYEFLTSPDHKLGGRNILRGKKNCQRCHLSSSGELDLQTDEIVQGKIKMKRSRKPFEDKPIIGKKGLLRTSIQAAYDDEHIYIKLTWGSKGAVWSGEPYAKNFSPDRVSLQVNKASDNFARYGCFIACHSDSNGMPESPGKEAVKANPYYSKLKRDDVRIYAFYTRKEGGGWDNMKDSAALEAGRAEGLMDLWSIELKDGNAKTSDGWVFEDRRFEESSDINGTAVWRNVRGGNIGEYSVIFIRHLDTNDSNDVALKVGDAFTVAISIHDDNTSKRRHYVSLPMTIGLGAAADIKAARK